MWPTIAGSEAKPDTLTTASKSPAEVGGTVMVHWMREVPLGKLDGDALTAQAAPKFNDTPTFEGL